jgi:hypothetical protein
MPSFHESPPRDAGLQCELVDRREPSAPAGGAALFVYDEVVRPADATHLAWMNFAYLDVAEAPVVVARSRELMALTAGLEDDEIRLESPAIMAQTSHRSLVVARGLHPLGFPRQRQRCRPDRGLPPTGGWFRGRRGRRR